MDLTYKIVRRLLRDDEVSFSRNKNFEAYEDERVKRAVRIFRHLESVEKEIVQAESSGSIDIDVVERDGRQMVEFGFARKGGRRVSFVEPGEWVLLKENDTTKEILEGLVDRAEPEIQKRLEQIEMRNKNDEDN